MIKKLTTISLTLIAAFSIAATPAFASNSHSNKSEIVYDTPDSGDNAHPSGKDRSVEQGGSLTQGKSNSDPDNNGKGPDRLNTGLDKPGMGGGVDKADQDGNNGCGNDDDFEDDNEGWCGHKPKNETTNPETPGVGTPTTPAVATPATPVTPTVLTISTLPNTANGEQDNYAFVWVSALLITSGIALHLGTKKYESVKA
ncbi:MAG TPA: hypothetical protein VLE47_00260 [Candidatus Saccharimonadales bacterium]|nr:hypothetical protein [Candidatus Saccharimonadales bacterium]